MSNGVRWRRLPEERPHQILDAAFEVFGEHGLASARLDDIAKRAGVAKGTIYLYFPNKEALFKEMIRQTVIAHLERSERDFVADTAAPATTDQLRDYMQGYVVLTRSPAYQVVMRLVIAELHRFPEFDGVLLGRGREPQAPVPRPGSFAAALSGRVPLDRSTGRRAHDGVDVRHARAVGQLGTCARQPRPRPTRSYLSS